MKIVNFGSCNLDHVYRLDHIVKVGETEQSVRMEVFPGGKGLNQSIAIAKAGALVYHAGCVGPDGEILLSALENCGVDLSFMQKVDKPSGHAVIQVSREGENAIFIHTGSNGMLTKEMIDGVLSKFQKGDFLLLQNETNNVEYIAAQGHKKGLIIFFNPSPIDRTIDLMDFSTIDYVILNEIEGEYLSGCTEPVKIVSALRTKYPLLKVVLTLGEKGCIYHDGQSLYYHAAYDVPVVDSTAAGDAFMGYFVASLAENRTADQILERACAASALVVSEKGAAPSIPCGAKVTEALRFLKEKNVGLKNKNEELRCRIDRYMEEHLQEANLSDLAGFLNYSAAYAGRIVKSVMGKSFARCIQEKRCSAAARYLWETDLPVSEIINLIGYKNESFFRNKFTVLYGMTPASYRKSLNRGKEKNKG